jgi:WD40 repeat protein
MTERDDLDAFELRLADLVRAYTQPAERPTNPLATARLAMDASAGRMARLERAWLAHVDARAVALLVTVGVLLALAALAITGGYLQRRDEGPLATAGQLVFVRNGDLYTSDADGRDIIRIHRGGEDGTALGYLAALWSPDLRHIAAIRDTGGPVLTPVVEIMATDGSNVRTIELGAGGLPSLSWAPDGSQLAVASYPGEVARDATAPVHTQPRLHIVGLDGDSAEISVPSGASLPAQAQPGLWDQPSAGLAWSPDGRWIAMAWDGGGTLDHWHLVSPDGSAIRTLTSFTKRRCGVAAWIAWFPDGQRLATIGGDQMTGDLCVEDVESDDATPAPPTVISRTADTPTSDVHQKLQSSAVSADGSRIAVVAESADFGKARHTTTLRVYDLAARSLIDVASGTQAIIIDAPGEGHVDGTLDGTPVWGPIAWSPDGTRLLFLSPVPGNATASWTLVSVGAAGEGQPSIVLEGIRSYDVAGVP